MVINNFMLLGVKKIVLMSLCEAILMNIDGCKKMRYQFEGTDSVIVTTIYIDFQMKRNKNF